MGCGSYCDAGSCSCSLWWCRGPSWRILGLRSPLTDRLLSAEACAEAPALAGHSDVVSFGVCYVLLVRDDHI